MIDDTPTCSTPFTLKRWYCVRQISHHHQQLPRHANAEMNSTFHDKDGQPWKEGDTYTRPKYADTLEVIDGITET